jgi:predicted CopG family antitoxin
VKSARGSLVVFFSLWYDAGMTVSEIVDKVSAFYHEKPVKIRDVRRFLNDNKIRVSEESVLKIMDVYNRQLIDRHMKDGEENFTDAHNIYVEARKELDLTITSISKKLSTEEIIDLRKKINDLINAAIIWSKK